MNHQSQADLLTALFAIIPGFEAEWQLDCAGDEDPSTSLHSVYLSFLPYVSGLKPAEEQLRRLGAFVSAAVEAGGDAENAVSTSFLEHLHQVGFERALRPFLSPAARSRLHA